MFHRHADTGFDRGTLTGRMPCFIQRSTALPDGVSDIRITAVSFYRATAVNKQDPLAGGELYQIIARIAAKQQLRIISQPKIFQFVSSGPCQFHYKRFAQKQQSLFGMQLILEGKKRRSSSCSDAPEKDRDVMIPVSSV